jgi:hypothetical protein
MGQTRPASAGECGDGGKNGGSSFESQFNTSIPYFVVKDGTNILQYQSPILTSRAITNIHERNPSLRLYQVSCKNKHIDSMPSEMFIATQVK